MPGRSRARAAAREHPPDLFRNRAAPGLAGWEDEPPSQPRLQAAKTRDGLKLSRQSGGGPVALWVLQKRAGGHWTTEILPHPAPARQSPPPPARRCLERDCALRRGSLRQFQTPPALFHAAR